VIWGTQLYVSLTRLWDEQFIQIVRLQIVSPFGSKRESTPWVTCATHENYSWLYSKNWGPKGNSVYWHMFVSQRETCVHELDHGLVMRTWSYVTRWIVAPKHS
jgi:hypothetical protein